MRHTTGFGLGSCLAVIGLTCGIVGPLQAQVAPGTAPAGGTLAPLVTESANPLPNGHMQVSLGAAFSYQERFPLFTPAGALSDQKSVHGPQIGMRIGAGDWVELQASFAMLYLDERATSGETNTQYGPGDVNLYTKVRVLNEGPEWPVLGIRFGVQLPNAVRANRLGTDETNFIGDLLASYQIGPVWTHLNLGMTLLTVPTPRPYDDFTSEGQDDLFVYHVAAVSPWWGEVEPGATQIRLLGEVAGSVGSRFDNDRADVRTGLQLRWGRAMLFAGMSVGIVTESETFGAYTGFTYFIDFKELLQGD